MARKLVAGILTVLAAGLALTNLVLRTCACFPLLHHRMIDTCLCRELYVGSRVAFHLDF